MGQNRDCNRGNRQSRMLAAATWPRLSSLSACSCCWLSSLYLWRINATSTPWQDYILPSPRSLANKWGGCNSVSLRLKSRTTTTMTLLPAPSARQL
jgi:hypothetical protein